MRFRLGILLLLGFWCATRLAAQEPSAPLSEKRWEEIRKSYDYPDPEEKAPEEIRENSDLELSPWVIQVLKVLLILSGVAILIWGFLSLQGGLWSPANKRFNSRNQLAISLEQVERHLDKADLSGLLRQAQEAGAYRIALRLRYLMLIRALAETGWIEWQPDKTNGHYVRKLYHTAHGAAFSERTRIYEAIWYGDQALSREEFQNLEPRFSELEASIRKSKATV